MSTKHTPGPWTIWNFDEDPRHLYVGPQSGGLAIADVVACNAHGCYTAETEQKGRDNARLIAAAPELLAALEKALRYGGLFPDLAEEARAAIAKATGEQ